MDRPRHVSVAIVLGATSVIVALVAALLPQDYCIDMEQRFGGLAWLLTMAPVVLFASLMAAALVTAATPDALGLVAWVGVMVLVPLATAAGYALGLQRLGCEVRSLDSVLGLALFAAVPAAGIGGIIGWIVGVRRGR